MANVRSDGIAVVLGPLLDDPRTVAAVLVDVDSGMVLDAWSAADPVASAPDLELIGAQHAEIVRTGLAVLRAWPAGPGAVGTCEVVLGADGGCQHLLRTVPDPHGDRLALAVVVDGPPRVLERVRRRLRAVAVDAPTVDALTAGPSMSRRPVRGAWSFAPPAPDVPASPPEPPVDARPRTGGVRPPGAEPPTGPLPLVLPGPRGGRPSPPAALPAPVAPIERSG